MPKVLLVEDDSAAALMLSDWLSGQKYVVEVAGNATDALYMIENYQFDVIILDWELPGSMSGLDFVERYRETGGNCPILMLTGKTTIKDKTTGLDTGADDYLIKPFDLGELSSRIRALLRRPAQAKPCVLEHGRLKLDPISSTAFKNGVELELLPKEYALLEFFMRHPNQLVSPDMLLDKVWKSDSDTTPLAIRTQIARLRQKIDTEGEDSPIENIRGMGYRFRVK